MGTGARARGMGLDLGPEACRKNQCRSAGPVSLGEASIPRSPVPHLSPAVVPTLCSRSLPGAASRRTLIQIPFLLGPGKGLIWGEVRAAISPPTPPSATADYLRKDNALLQVTPERSVGHSGGPTPSPHPAAQPSLHGTCTLGWTELSARLCRWPRTSLLLCMHSGGFC